MSQGQSNHDQRLIELSVEGTDLQVCFHVGYLKQTESGVVLNASPPELDALVQYAGTKSDSCEKIGELKGHSR